MSYQKGSFRIAPGATAIDRERAERWIAELQKFVDDEKRAEIAARNVLDPKEVEHGVTVYAGNEPRVIVGCDDKFYVVDAPRCRHGFRLHYSRLLSAADVAEMYSKFPR